MNPLIQFNRTSLPIVIVSLLTCFSLCPTGLAISPLPDGGYGNGNTAEGTDALFSFTGITPANGLNNTAIGFKALFNNTAGSSNTATGFEALFRNTTISGKSGDANTANGFEALFNNTTGMSNTASGNVALFSNSTGGDNTAIGDSALYHNTIGFENTAIGFGALNNNTSGHLNIALGVFAGTTITRGTNNIDIGNNGGAALESNTIRIGAFQTATFIAGIFGTTITGSQVGVDSSGHLGVLATSSARFKDDIKPMDKASEAIFALKPVTFRYKKQLDPKGIAQFGLVAEEVEKVNSALITRDTDGKPYTVRYEAVNAMLLNEFLKEHRKVEELEARLVQQQKDFTARLKEQDAKIQKVSDKMELTKPAPQVVDSNQ